MTVRADQTYMARENFPATCFGDGEYTVCAGSKVEIRLIHAKNEYDLKEESCDISADQWLDQEGERFNFTGGFEASLKNIRQHCILYEEAKSESPKLPTTKPRVKVELSQKDMLVSTWMENEKAIKFAMDILKRALKD